MFRSEDVPVSLIGVLLNEMVERVETEFVFAFVSGLDCGRAVSAIESNKSDVLTFFFPKDGSERPAEIERIFSFLLFCVQFFGCNGRFGDFRWGFGSGGGLSEGDFGSSWVWLQMGEPAEGRFSITAGGTGLSAALGSGLSLMFLRDC